MAESVYTLWPGGFAAIAEGCRCPVVDNGHGSVSLARDRGGWVIVSDCPLHGLAGSHFAPIPPSELGVALPTPESE